MDEEVKDKVDDVIVTTETETKDKPKKVKKEKDKTWWPLTFSIIGSVFALFGAPCILISIAGLVLSAISLSMLLKKDGKEYAHRSVSFALSVFGVTLSSLAIVGGFFAAILINKALNQILYAINAYKYFMYF